MSSSSWLGRFILPALIMILLSACGPAAPAADQPAATAPIATDIPVPTATAEPPSPTPKEPPLEADADDGNGDEQAQADTEAIVDSTVDADASDVSVYRLGDPNAPIVLVEYSDYQCPFCQRHFRDTLPQLKETFIDTGRIRYEFRDFPIATLHPYAHRLHEATYCAGEGGGFDAFWAAHDLLFSQPQRFQAGSLAATDVVVIDGFVEAGLPDPSACLIAGTFAAQVEAAVAEGKARGVSGTPSFFIRDFNISGAQPFEAFAAAIEAAEQGTLTDTQAGSAQPTVPDVADETLPVPVTFEQQLATSLGNPDAPVTIVEFSDYQCPFCQRHALQTMPQLKQLIDAGRVYYEFRDFPIASIHPLAYLLHEAARCVQAYEGTEAFWLAHDLFFAQADAFKHDNEEEMNISIELELARINLWTSDVEQCYANGEYREAVAASVAEAGRLELSGTPSFFIDGFLLVGAQPYATFEQAVVLAEEGRLAEALRPQNAPPPAAAPPSAGSVNDVVLTGDEPVKGAPDAPVTIVEFSSYQCPFCKRHFDQTMPSIEPYIADGTVRYIYKDFPLPTQPQAFKAHEAAHCVMEQGGDDGYWAYHNILFEEQANWSRVAMGEHVGVLKELARRLEFLDGPSFDSCLDSDQFAERVRRDYAEGTALSVRGTPSFFINGQFISGAQPFEVFAQLIEAALEE